MWQPDEVGVVYIFLLPHVRFKNVIGLNAWVLNLKLTDLRDKKSLRCASLNMRKSQRFFV